MSETTRKRTSNSTSSASSDSGAEAPFPFPVVAIGASAGGVEAVGSLLERLPPDSRAAFIVVLHLDPEHESYLAEVFGRRTRMPVVQITDGMALQSDRVHVIAPDLTLTIKDARLRLTPPSQARGFRRPVDELFQSLAAAAGARSVAVVMSGTGTNGSAGLAEVKANDGVIFAQDPATAAFDGMPRGAIETGLVDQVLEPAAMAEAISRYIRSDGAPAAEDEEVDRSFFEQVLDLLREHSQLELQNYRRPTFIRRINRRMSLRGLCKPADYVSLLREDSAERDSLINDLLIKVTSFFRDAESWEALNQQVIAPLVQTKERGGEIRCWVPACSSGEEAYTLAILLTEQIEAAAKHLGVRIFATDLSRAAIARARAGVFPAGIAIQVPPERLERFFDLQDHHYRVKERIRETITFAPHNLLADPPFSHLDIATCRNVLIYLEPESQKKVLGILHFALQPDGVLMLGSSESPKRGSRYFRAIAPKHKIYRKVGMSRPEFAALPLVKSRKGAVPRQTGASSAHDVGSIALHALAKLTPAATVLDGRQRVIYFHGDTDRYLATPHGKADLDVFGMARPGLEAPVRNVISRARHHAESATAEVPFRAGSERVRVYVTATRLERDDLVLLSFRQEPVSEAEQQEPARGDDDTGDDKSKDLLREELRQSHLELARTIEDLEQSNESLTSSNEEVMSINEELQSTNEELETSKEELQSLNEELSTVNAQLQNKLDELESTTNNLANLLKSSDIATLFLSRDMKVNWFTPAVGRLFSLIESDTGRPITDFSQKFVDGDIREDCQKVLQTLVPITKEIKDTRGRWYLRRITPYRTADDKIEGVVMTFVDISDSKRSEKKATRAAATARKAASAKDTFLARLSHELRTPLQPALLGLSGLAARDDLPLDMAEKIATITRNIEIEIRLIDDLLDLTRVGHGKLRLKRERIDALQLVKDSIRLCQDESAAKHQQVIVEGTPGESWIEVDKLRLQQVIWNLLRNAIRFTRENGTVSLCCERRGDQVLIEVVDDGVGIPPDLLPRIFDSFERSGESFSGLGLGLSIAKSLVEAHDGTIEAESEGVGRGSTFRVWLPAAECPEQQEVGEESGQAVPRNAGAGNGKGDLTGLRILVIEDHPDSARVLASLLQAVGCRTSTAGTVKDALKAVQEEQFDLILSDLALPDGNGYDLAGKLPEEIPAIAFSGFGAPEDIERSLNAGFVEHLVKPVTISELRTAIDRALSR